MITREAAGTLITHAGPEIGVASTKAFTCQLTALFLIAMYLGQVRETLDEKTSQKLVEQLLHVAAQIEEMLRRDAIYEDLTKALFRASDFLYLGRGIHFPIALEGALKLKEISYIHAEGYPAGEMKHGPNALIDENLPAVVLATRDPDDELSRVLYEKTLSNIQEVKAREGIVVAVACEGDEEVTKVADHVIPIGNDARAAAADSRSGAAADAGVSHRGAPRLRRGSAAQSGEERYGGVNYLHLHHFFPSSSCAPW